MLEERLLISSPFTESWVGWIMLALLVLMLLAYAMQPDVLRLSFSTLFSSKDRNSTFLDSSFDLRAQLLMMLYNMCIVGMAIYALFAAYIQDLAYSGLAYLEIVLLLSGVELLRWLLQRLVAYVFFPRGALESVYRHYYYLVTAVSTVLYPMVLLTLFFPWLTNFPIFMLIWVVFGCYFLLMLYKLFITFVHSLMAIVYVLFFMLTLEIVPMAGVLLLCNMILRTAL